MPSYDEGDTWYPYFSNNFDIEPGLAQLRNDMKDAALEKVESDSTLQYFLLAGGVLVGLVCGMVIEMITRRHIHHFKDTLLLLRLLPTRLIDDYGVIEKVLSVTDEDDDQIDLGGETTKSALSTSSKHENGRGAASSSAAQARSNL